VIAEARGLITVDAKSGSFYAAAHVNRANTMRSMIVRRSPLHGRGAFAMKPLAANERVLQCMGEITSRRNAVRRHQREGVEGLGHVIEVSLRFLVMKIPNRSIMDIAFSGGHQLRRSLVPSVSVELARHQSVAVLSAASW
jgi:hypothetical protein